MPAFSKKTAETVMFAADQVLSRLAHTVEYNRFTHAEFEQMFIKPEHRAINAQLRHLDVEINNSERHVDIGEMSKDGLPEWVTTTSAKVQFMGSYGGILPSYIKHGWLNCEANQELIEIAKAQLLYANQINLDYSVSKNALRQLLDICDTPAQAQFYLPSLSRVMDTRDELKTLAKSIQGRAAPGVIPTLHPDLREDLATCNRSISKCLVMGHVPSPTYYARDVLITPRRTLYKRGWNEYGSFTVNN